MAYNFLACDRDQAFLLPPDLRDWLPSDHLAWFVLDVVDQLDLGPFLKAYRADGHGRAAYEPRMLLAVLLYGATAPGSAPPARSNAAARKTSPSGSWPATPRLIM
jgi:transposase